VDGLEHGVLLADVGATGRADAALELGGLVGQDVAVEIREDEDLEVAAALLVDELGRHDVDVPVVGVDARVLLGDAIEVLEEAAVGRLDDVGLGDARDPLPPVLLGVLEGQPADAVGARAGDELEVDRDVVVDVDAVGAEGVEVLRVFAEEDPVDALLGDADGPDVGEEVELLADGHVAALDIRPGVALARRRRGALEGDGVFLDLVQDVGRDGAAVGGPVLDGQPLDIVDDDAAGFNLVLEQESKDALRLGGDVDADAIPRQDADLERGEPGVVDPAGSGLDLLHPFHLLLEEPAEMLLGAVDRGDVHSVFPPL